MIEENLIQYGALGLFVAYLIFDRQVLIKQLQYSIDRNTEVLKGLCAAIKKK